MLLTAALCAVVSLQKGCSGEVRFKCKEYLSLVCTIGVKGSVI